MLPPIDYTSKEVRASNEQLANDVGRVYIEAPEEVGLWRMWKARIGELHDTIG